MTAMETPAECGNHGDGSYGRTCQLEAGHPGRHRSCEISWKDQPEIVAIVSKAIQKQMSVRNKQFADQMAEAIVEELGLTREWSHTRQGQRGGADYRYVTNWALDGSAN